MGVQGPPDHLRLIPVFVRALLENLSDMIFVLDIEGKPVHANKTALDTLGLDQEELIRGDLESFLSTMDAQAIRRFVREIQVSRLPRVLAISAKSNRLGKLTLEVVLGPLVDPADRVIGAWLRAKDVTERKQFEMQLEETRSFIEKVVSSLDEGLVTIDREMLVVRWSQAMERILRLSSKEMVGVPFQSILKDDKERRRFEGKMREVLAGRSVADVEYTYQDKEDREVVMSISSSPLVDRQGRVREIVLIMKDLTEKKHLEERLKESEKRLATEVIKKIEDLKYIEQLNRLVVEYMEEGALLLDASLDIGFVNPKLVKLLDYTIEEVIGRPLKMIVPEDLLWAWNEIPERSKRGSYKFESSLLRKDGEEIPVMVTSSSIKIETRKAEVLCTVIDLSEQKAREEKVREDLMAFKLKPGHIYLMVERGYTKALDVLLTLRHFGHTAMIITRRTSKDSLKEILNKIEAETFWLDEKGRGDWVVAPTMEALISFVQKKVDRTKVLLLDRCDYLVSKMGFDGFRNLLHGLVDLFYLKKAILVLLVEASSLTQEQIELLGKDASLVEAKRTVILPEDMQELLVYINQQNRIGIEPSYKEIGKRFNITKTTTRKRLQQLIILDLIIETKHGRTKVLSVTDKGVRFVSTVDR